MVTIGSPPAAPVEMYQASVSASSLSASPCTNLQRALAVLPASLAYAMVSAVGNVIQPTHLQLAVTAMGTALSQQVVALEQAARQDMPPLADALIAESLDVEKNPGLADWITNGPDRDAVVDSVIKLRGYMEARNGNYVRSEFQSLLGLYMASLGFPNEPCVFLSDVCQNLKDALSADLGGKNSALDNAARSVNRAGYAVREITNKYSHPPAQPMYDADVYELCGSFKSLGAALPTVAANFYCPPQPEAPESLSLALSSLPTSLANLSADDVAKLVHQYVAGLQQSPAVAAATSSTTPTTTHSPVTTLTSSSSSSSSPTSSPSSATRRWETRGLRVSPPSSPPRPREPRATIPSPSREALEAAATYQLYYSRPTELPVDADRSVLTSKMFRRMLNHVAKLPKASLCELAPGHDAACGKSHSYLEVMSYNPLYKLSICRQCDHFWRRDTAEESQCVCLHVNTGIDVVALAESLLRAKSSRCVSGARCKDKTCIKSHSLEEACWFNPKYKIARCHASSGCRRSGLECTFAHEGERVRGVDEEDDYVGKSVRVLFVERTHQALADALEALRALRSPVS